MKKNSPEKNKLSWVIILSIILYVFISLFYSSRDISLWGEIFTNPTFITGTIFSFVVIAGIMSLFLWFGYKANQVKISFFTNLGVAIPSIVLAVGMQQFIFYTFFYETGQLFFSTPSMLLPVIIAGVIHLFSTALLLQWYSKIKLRQGLKIGIISTIIPFIFVMFILILALNFVGMSAI